MGRMALRLHGGVGVLLTPDRDAHRAGHEGETFSGRLPFSFASPRG